MLKLPPRAVITVGDRPTRHLASTSASWLCRQASTRHAHARTTRPSTRRRRRRVVLHWIHWHQPFTPGGPAPPACRGDTWFTVSKIPEQAGLATVVPFARARGLCNPVVVKVQVIPPSFARPNASGPCGDKLVTKCSLEARAFCPVVCVAGGRSFPRPAPREPRRGVSSPAAEHCTYDQQADSASMHTPTKTQIRPWRESSFF